MVPAQTKSMCLTRMAPSSASLGSMVARSLRMLMKIHSFQKVEVIRPDQRSPDTVEIPALMMKKSYKDVKLHFLVCHIVIYRVFLKKWHKVYAPQYQGRSNWGYIGIYTLPKSGQVNFLWSNNEVRTVLKVLYLSKNFYTSPNKFLAMPLDYILKPWPSYYNMKIVSGFGIEL